MHVARIARNISSSRHINRSLACGRKCTVPTRTRTSAPSHKRWCSAAAEVLAVTGDDRSYKLVIPLPSQGRQVFSLPTRGSIRSVLEIMRIDDSEIENVEVLDTAGNRIARSILTEDLIKTDFRLKINDKVYDVKAPSRSLLGKRTVVIAGRVADQAQFQKVKEYMIATASKSSVLELSVYLDKCLDLGIEAEQATEILKLLSKLGVVLYVPEGLELHTKIFLNPKQISETVEATFHLEKIRLTLEERIALLKQLQEEVAPLAAKHDLIMSKADARVQAMAWSIFIGLCGQFLLFARLTWWDFSWDVMEPVTYFTTVVEGAIAGYIYYLATRDEYTNMSFRQILTDWQFRRLCQSEGFDNDHYEKLKQRIGELETDIHYTANPTLFTSPEHHK